MKTPDRPDDEADAPPRGRIGLHAVAVVVLLGSAYLLLEGNLSASLELVWWSLGLSGLAILVAILALVAPARGARRLPSIRSTRVAERPLGRPWEGR